MTHSFSLTDGVCGRTPQVRDKLVDLVKANDATVTNCSLVTDAHLGALTGTLNLNGLSNSGLGGNRMTGLKAGDFAGLTGITALVLASNDLRDIPAGVFDDLTVLTVLELQSNGTFTTLPAGLFDRLTGLTGLRLDNNDLSSLPPRLFEKLTALIDLSLSRNPGSASFVPISKAGPEGGIEVVSGGTVTLGDADAAAGYDDPWGANIQSYSWMQTEGAGGTLTDNNAAQATFTAPVTTEDETHTLRLTVTGRGGSHAGAADVNVRVAAGPKVDVVEFVGTPRGESGGRTVYAQDEFIEVALRFDRAVTVDSTGGTPSVALTVGTTQRTAEYRRGTGVRQLVFGYTVASGDSDSNGVDLVANSLALNGGTIAGVSDNGAAALDHAALAGGADRGVNGALIAQGLGICGRPPAVQAAILERVKANHPTVTSCTQVTVAHLSAVTGTLDVSAQVTAHGRMTALKAGDFAGLTGLTGLDLDDHALRVFPAGIFDPLTSLTELSIAYNQTQASDSLMTLPAGLFDRLTRLTVLRLEQNDLETLPDRIFEKLTNLATLTFNGNPGSASFLPVAVAGPAGGFDAKAGDTVTLGGDAGGPWGSNLVYSWSKASGTVVDPSATDVAKPTVTAPALAEAAVLEYGLTVTGRGTSLTATDSVTVRVAAAALVSSVAPVSEPVSGDTYKRGEMIEIAVTFGKPVTVTGTPRLALAVGTATRQAGYVRGSGTNRLVFEYTVGSGDADTDGVAIAADSLALNGGTIRDADGVAASLDHDALAAQSGHKVDGSTAALTGGVCGRTPQIRDKLVDLVKVNDSTVTNCSLVTNTHLGALTGTLNLNGLSNSGLGGNRMSGLKAGDFAGLTGITALVLASNPLRDIPAGVFDDLTVLTVLELQSNGTFTTLPAGLFDRLTGLTGLRLDNNDLSSLPPRLFEKLTALTDLSLSRNPGSASFVPISKAGPEGGIEVIQGAAVTLGVTGAANGFDDPWGANIKSWSWSRTAGTSVTLTNGTSARPSFTAPSADETMTFELTVTGKGGSHTATDTVSVRVGTAGSAADAEERGGGGRDADADL